MTNEEKDIKTSQPVGQAENVGQVENVEQVEEDAKDDGRSSGGEGAPSSESLAGQHSPENSAGLSSAPGAVPPPSPPHNALAAFVLDMDRVEAERAAAAGQPSGGAHGEGNTPRRRSLTPDAIAAYAEAYGKYVQAQERLIAAKKRRAAHQVRLRGPFYSVERPTGRVLAIFAIVILVILAAGFIALLVCAIILAFRWIRRQHLVFSLLGWQAEGWYQPAPQKGHPPVKAEQSSLSCVMPVFDIF